MGSMGGKGGGDASDYADALSDIAMQTFEEATPLRQQLISNWGSFLGMPSTSFSLDSGAGEMPQLADYALGVTDETWEPGQTLFSTGGDTVGFSSTNLDNMSGATGEYDYDSYMQALSDYLSGGGLQVASTGGEGSGYNVESSPMWDVYKNQIEQNYDTAKAGTMESLPAGGALLESLADLESDKASDMTNAMGSVAQSEYDKLYQYVTGQPATSTTALSSAAESMSGLESQMYASNMSSMTEIGKMMGGKDWGTK